MHWYWCLGFAFRTISSLHPSGQLGWEAKFQGIPQMWPGSCVWSRRAAASSNVIIRIYHRSVSVTILHGRARQDTKHSTALSLKLYHLHGVCQCLRLLGIGQKRCLTKLTNDCTVRPFLIDVLPRTLRRYSTFYLDFRMI